MSRYIDADEEIRKINEAIFINEQGRKEESLASYCLRRVAEALAKAPTADVENVVRCKDCKFRYTQTCFAKHETADNDFCSCGAKMEVEKV